MAFEPFIGEICIYGFNFAPEGWSTCGGQQLAVQQNAALFSLLGTTFGGNGTQYFNLPNLMGRVPLGASNSLRWGQVGGTETVTLTANQLPAHTHGSAFTATTSVKAAVDGGNTITPAANVFLAKGVSTLGDETKNYFSGTPSNSVALGGVSTQIAGNTAPAGAGQPVSIMQPFLALNFCIALTGVYPTRP